MISIHVLRAEDDRKRVDYLYAACQFQSTSSVRRTTSACWEPAAPAAISIHVLRAEDDSQRPIGYYRLADFNPRPPCGGRPLARRCFSTHQRFQSTSSVWRTTHRSCCRPCSVGHFNPRPPCGGRRKIPDLASCFAKFQSTSSVWRTTLILGIS